MTKWQLRLLLILTLSWVSLVSAGVVVAVVAIIYAYATTPLTTIYFHNDLKVAAEITFCNADPQTIPPGKTAAIDVISTTRTPACGVYVDPPNFEGCIYLPADTYPAGSDVYVSQMVRGVSDTECLEANE